MEIKLVNCLEMTSQSISALCAGSGPRWQHLPDEVQTACVFLYVIKEKAERLMVRKTARKNHLLINIFLISLVYWFDEGKNRYVTGMVKIFFGEVVLIQLSCRLSGRVEEAVEE